MELTKEILEKNKFINNHPERVLGKFYCSNPEGTYRIMVEGAYIPKTNKLGWMASAWLSQDGVIVKRASASVITTVEELQSVINLTGIDLLIYSL